MRIDHIVASKWIKSKLKQFHEVDWIEIEEAFANCDFGEPLKDRRQSTATY